MGDSVWQRLLNGWNAFRARDRTVIPYYGTGYMSYRPDRTRFSRGNERTIVTAVYNRIAVDVAQIPVKHVRLDKDGRFLEDINDDLNNCLTMQANIDQSGRAFILDVVSSMLDEGCVAIMPVDTDINPQTNEIYSIYTMRTGQITDWFPYDVRIKAYREETGQKEEVVLKKSNVCVCENPFYSVMNEPNSVLQRLVRKLTLLDVVDEQTSSGKLDLIIQLPYVIKREAQREQAEKRRAEIEKQLSTSKYGIAYTDGTEHIVQLNKTLENNLLNQIEYLTELLYSQLGITKEVMNGTADEKAMLNYYNRTIEPIISAITDEMNRKFLTQKQRENGEAIRFYREPFRLVPTEQLAEIADKFTRNEIMTSNEIRQVIGMKPSDDPKADELRNSNIAAAKQEVPEEEKNDELRIKN